MKDEGRLCSETAEISVLGAMLIDGDACAEAVGLLQAGDFFFGQNALIFRALCRLHERGVAADVVTLSDELKATGHLEEAGGMAYLARLVDAVPTAANVAHHANRVRELAALRDLQEAARETIGVADRAGVGAGPEIIARSVANLRERLDALEQSAAPDNREGLRTAAEILADPEVRRTPVTVAEGLAWAGRTTLLAGREKAGKSTLLRWAVARVSRGERVWDGPPTETPQGVLFWGQEHAVDIAADLERLRADLSRVLVRDMRLHLGDRFALLARDVERSGAGLLVVDTLSTFVDQMGLDSGAAGDWEPVMNRFGALAEAFDLAVVLNHHARKSDGQYRDSTAIGAGVDAILHLRLDREAGESVRRIEALARAAIPATDFRFQLAGPRTDPRLERIDASLPLEGRVRQFVVDHPGCSQRDVLEGVTGRTEAIRDVLQGLSENGGPLACDDSGSPFRYRLADSPNGNGTETEWKHQGNAGTGNGGRSVSRGGERPVGSPLSETPPEPVDPDEPNQREEELPPTTCPSCGGGKPSELPVCETCQYTRAQLAREAS